MMGSNPDGGRIFFTSETFDAPRRRRRESVEGEVTEPARQVPLHASCDVLIVGGGPSGTAAAVAAARLGADTILLERYNHLGGLATGGLVIWIDRMSDWQGRPVIRGIAEELLDRLTPDQIAGPKRNDWGSRDEALADHWALRSAAYHGIVTNSPTLDPEWLKARSLDMVLEAGVHLIFHAWGAAPIMSGSTIRGAIFESKQGRRAIRAKVVIDATGDGDILAAAGAQADTDVDRSDIHGCMNTAWLFGGVDMKRFLDFRIEDPEGYRALLAEGRKRLGPFERPVVSWRDDIAVFMGPRFAGYSAIDVEDQSEVEIRSNRAMRDHLAFYRAEAPGFSNAFVMLHAPQLGVRHARRLKGRKSVLRGHWDGRVHADEIGVSPALSPKFPNISVPYGALVPKAIDGLLAPGRHLSSDTSSHSFMREIPQCWLTGHAAGVAAAVSVARSVAPGDAPTLEIRSALAAQGAYLQNPA